MSEQELVGVAALPKRLLEMTEADRKLVEQIFRIDELIGLNEVPEALRAKVSRWCGSSENECLDAPTATWRRAARQTVISVTNTWTFETANFNVLRSCRPVQGKDGTAGPDEIATSCEGPERCDFCDLEKLTCTEPIGRIRGKHSTTAGNVFKSAGYHGLVIWTNHYPHRLTTEELVDGFEIADKWFSQSLALNAREGGTLSYPFMFWNIFKSGGASQIHPHMQLQLFGAPVAQGLLYKDQCESYRRKFGEDADLVQDIFRAHDNLGFASKVGKLRCWVSLTPRVGGGELSVLSPPSEGADPCPKLASVAFIIAAILRTLRRCGMEGISIGGYPVPTVSGTGNGSTTNAWLVRCSGRGLATTSITDAGSAELVGLAGVGSDPVFLVDALREELQELEN